jgi:CRISPR system Cascade subunit CasA
MPSFNLVDQPWIPCRLTNGGLVEFALRDTLRRAAEIEAITGESPMVTITIHRLLLAILHRCFGPADTSAWGGLWRVGRFDPTMVDRYLDRWRERFDLFDPERPFFQVSTLDGTKGVYPLWRALQVMAEPLLFDHASEFKPRAVTPAEAARLLIAFQSFDYGGIKSAETSRHFAKASPLVQRAVALVRGPTLFHTLLLNLHKYNADDETPFPFDAAEDAPAWEHEHQTEPRERSVRGPLDLLTWQSRRLRLLPETAVDGSTCVRSVVVMMGWQFPNSFDVGQGYETMVAFRPNLQAKTTGNAWIPIGFREDRALWRTSRASDDAQLAG